MAWALLFLVLAFVKLPKCIVKNRARILAAIEHRPSNGLVEFTNAKAG